MRYFFRICLILLCFIVFAQILKPSKAYAQVINCAGQSDGTACLYSGSFSGGPNYCSGGNVVNDLYVCSGGACAFPPQGPTETHQICGACGCSSGSCIVSCTPSATPTCTNDFQYNECVSCNTSRPVYRNSCTGAFSTGANQSDGACASLCTGIPTDTPVPTPVPVCVADTWDATRCATCKGDGSGWNSQCTNFGTTPPSTAAGNPWCSCASRCPGINSNPPYNSTNYPACFGVSTPTPTNIPEQPKVTIQGHHKDVNGNDITISGMGVTITPTDETSSSSYFVFDTLDSSNTPYTVTANGISGYTISCTYSKNSTSPKIPCTNGRSLSVTLPDDGDYADIYFKYTPNTSPTLTPTRTPTPTITPTPGVLSLFVNTTAICTTNPNTESVYADWNQSGGNSYQVILRGGASDEIHTSSTCNDSFAKGITCNGNRCGLTFTARPALNASGLTVSVTAFAGNNCNGSFRSDSGPVPTSLSCGGPPPPSPTAGSSGCTITASPSTANPGGTFSGTITGPGDNPYQITCPDGTTRTVTAGSSYSCPAPSNSGNYIISAQGFSSGNITCSAPVRVVKSCTVFQNNSYINGPYIYTYKDTAYDNTNYDTVVNQWPQYYWCPVDLNGNDVNCTYGIRGSQPISNATRNDATYCGYIQIPAGQSGNCRIARFGVSSNYSSAYPFNQPLSLGITNLSNVVIHADSECGSYTAVTASNGVTSQWKDANGNVAYLPRQVGTTTASSVNYDIWAEVPSGRKFTRAVYFQCGGGSCVDFEGLNSSPPRYLGPGNLGAGNNPRFLNWSVGSSTVGNNFFFGFTNPGQEPVCTGVSAAPTTITRGQTVNFSNGTGFAQGGKSISGYGWDFDGNGTIERETPTGSANSLYNKAGTFNAQFFIKDNTDLFSFPTAACTKPITVTCDTLRVSPDPIIMSPGQTNLILTATGGNGDPSKLTWTIANNNIIQFAPPANQKRTSNTPVKINAIAEGTTLITLTEGYYTSECDMDACWDAFHEDPAVITNGCSIQTKTITVIVQTSPWFQGVGGDIRIDTGIANKVPNSVTPPSSRFTSIFGSGGTAGVIFAGDGVPPVNSPNFGQGTAPANTFASPNGWLVYGNGGKFTPVNNNIMRTSYRFMNDNIKTTITQLPADLTNLPGGVYSGEDISLPQHTFLPNNHYLFLIKGNLTIAGDIIVPVGSTATFIASGDIIFDKTVGGLAADTASHVEGFYSADENIIIEGNEDNCVTPDKRLNVSGTLISNSGMTLTGSSFQQNRDLCTTAGTNNNTKYPALTVTERPDFILNAPNFLKVPNYIWEEVAP